MENREAVRDLHAVRLGPETAPVVLFLHGITESHRYFTTRVSSLAGPFHLVLPDLPGFGRSPKPVIPYSIDLFVNSLREFIVEAGLAGKPLHIVAHSLGALIAVEYLRKHPGKIRRIVLLSLPWFPDPDTARRIFWNGSPSYRKLVRGHSLRASLGQLRRTGLTPALLNAWGIPMRVLFDCRRFTFQSLTSTLDNCLLNYSLDPALAGMPARPTLLLHGEKDQVAPFERVAELPGRFGHLRVRSFRGGGHHILHTHPGRCLKMIRDHLEGRIDGFDLSAAGMEPRS